MFSISLNAAGLQKRPRRRAATVTTQDSAKPTPTAPAPEADSPPEAEQPTA